jgi:hypothetical protein
MSAEVAHPSSMRPTTEKGENRKAKASLELVNLEDDFLAGTRPGRQGPLPQVFRTGTRLIRQQAGRPFVEFVRVQIIGRWSVPNGKALEREDRHLPVMDHDPQLLRQSPRVLVLQRANRRGHRTGKERARERSDRRVPSALCRKCRLYVGLLLAS